MAAQSTQCLAAYKQGHLSLKDFEWEPHLRPSSSPTKASDFIIPEIDLQLLYAHHSSINQCSPQNPLQPNPGYPSGHANLGDGISDSAQHSLQSSPGYPSGYANLGNRISDFAQNPLQPNPGYTNLVKRVSQAAASYGFFQVFNHRISLSALEALYDYGRRFFSLPLERKYEVAKLLVDPSAGPSGYICGNAADSPNKWWTEAIRVASTRTDITRSIAQCLFPNDEHEQQAFSNTVDECSNGFAKLAQELTIVLMEGLGLNGKELVEKYIKDKETAGLKLNHYPACPQPDMTLGLPPHSDVSILTLLWQDQVGGLQVHTDGEWINVKPRHDALVVNIGDFFQVWSNDYYRSIKHRVVLNTRESRYSIVYFYYSGLDLMLAPIQELLEKTKEGSKFRSTLMSEHRTYVYSQVIKRESQGVEYLKC